VKAKDAALAARLVEALDELPRVRKGLHAKSKFYDGFELELIAAEVSDGETQGGSHYFNVPPDLAPPILDAAEKVIRAKLKALGVSLSAGQRQEHES
jgi:hypothetical protein